MRLEVTGLWSGYGGSPVLKDVTIGVEAGEVVAVLGANGAGKSTLVKTIMGVVPLSKGTVFLDGVDLTGRSSVERAHAGVSWVPEGRRLFTSLSVVENLQLAADGAGASLEASLDDIHALFPDLASLMNRPAWALSGGQQQMVAVARALATRPRLLLLDEPSLGLAPRISSQVLASVARLANTGIAVLLVEQNVVAALKVAGRGVVLDSGQIALQGDSKVLAEDENIVRSYLSRSG